MLISSFPQSFTYTQETTYASIVATLDRQDDNSLSIFEETSFGRMTAILDLNAFQLMLLPTSQRGSLAGSALGTALWFLGLQEPNGQCAFSVISSLLAEPSSVGEVTLGFLGGLKIRLGHLNTPEDVATFGFNARTSYKLMTSVTGPTAPQIPCKDPMNDVCLAENPCPEELHQNEDQIRAVAFVFDPFGTHYPEAPASVTFPSFVESILEQYPDDDATVGNLLRPAVITASHLAGTAGVGRVVDSNLKVMGCEGLYVADASVLPVTSRTNTMATVMMVGRHAGVKFLEDLS